ncbi:hypothetical protein JCM15519_36900 [Fundidesulfovibrio butyratiphilus]
MASTLDPWIARRIGQPEDQAPAPDALARWQAARVVDIVKHARQHSPFYAERLPAALPNSQDPAELLAALPLLSAGDIREHGQAMLAVTPGEVERVVTLNTSGTSGAPKRIFFSSRDLSDTLEFFRVGLSGFVSPGDVVLILLPGRRPDGASDLLARALAGIGATPVLAPEGLPPERVSRLARERNAHCLAALPSQLEVLLRAAGPGAMGARRALVSGEPVAAELRVLALSAGVEIFAHYGLTETCFGGGVECDAHCGYHLREVDLFAEIIDPATGAPVEPGGAGEVTLTALGRRAMPLIRYRSGDFGRLLAGPCPCGSPLRRLGPLSGRIEPVPGGFRVSAPPKGGTDQP